MKERISNCLTNRTEQKVQCVIHSYGGDLTEDYEDPRIKATMHNTLLYLATIGDLPAGMVLCNDAVPELLAAIGETENI